jgi:23S rRNA (cytidine1920-2'-O)/16S rRNA (cytidine1409-2'-O)-methyltransferase
VRRRLDSELVRRGLAGSRTEAATAIRSGLVTVAGRPAEKPSTLVTPGEPIALSGPSRRFVSRGGEKLAAALHRFGVDPAGRDCLDAGASTGGFTDCLLRCGAARVLAVDVGYGQLAWSIRQDPRVTVLERTNVRELDPAALPFRPQVVTADLSFISLRLALPALRGVAAPGAEFVVLVKPQFEAGPGDIGSGGVVRDPAVWAQALHRVAEVFRETGVGPASTMASPLVGPAGNVEFFLHAVDGGPDAVDAPAVEAAVREGIDLRAAS